MADIEQQQKDEIIFVGTGASTGIPLIGHINDSCQVCQQSLQPNNPNRRNNVSLLVRVAKTNSNILIDCGKTFRSAFQQVLYPRKISSLSALLLTHAHADAVQGLDEIRGFQKFEKIKEEKEGPKKIICLQPIPTYLSLHTLNSLKTEVEEIMETSEQITKDPKTILNRKVSCLSLHLLSDQTPEQFTPPGSEPFSGFLSLPVEHGKGYQCLGFVFGTQTRVVYLSDVSSIGQESLDLLRSLPFVSILIIDCLRGEGKTHHSHFCLDQMWELVLILKPKRVFGVGVYCEIEHTETNTILASKLASLGPDCGVESVELAYDGLSLSVNL